MFIWYIYFQKGHLHHGKVSSNNQRVTLGELAAGTIWISARDVERSLPAWEEEIHILRQLDCTGEDNLGPIKGPMATRILRSPKTILTSKRPEIWHVDTIPIWISERHFRSKRQGIWDLIGCPTCRSRLDVEKTSVNSGIFTTTTLWRDIRALHFVLALTSALACARRSPFFSDYGCVLSLRNKSHDVLEKYQIPLSINMFCCSKSPYPPVCSISYKCWYRLV